MLDVKFFIRDTTRISINLQILLWTLFTISAIHTTPSRTSEWWVRLLKYGSYIGFTLVLSLKAIDLVLKMHCLSVPYSLLAATCIIIHDLNHKHVEYVRYEDLSHYVLLEDNSISLCEPLWHHVPIYSQFE